MLTAVNDIHEFWFGPLDKTGMPGPEQQKMWFNASDETDASLRQRFAPLVTAALVEELDDWASDDAGLIALVLLLDQFTRNIHRGAPLAFAGDPQALALSREAIAAGRDQRLPAIHRVFLYLPLEHSEDIAVQEECVSLFARLERDTGSQQVADFSRYAVAHRAVIARFGRFPHRNAILGRESTAAELVHLQQHGGF